MIRMLRKLLKFVLYTTPILWMTWFLVIKNDIASVESNSEVSDQTNQDVVREHKHNVKTESKVAKPLEPPVIKNSRPEIVDSKENDEIDKKYDRGYDGENPNELPEEDDSDDDDDKDVNSLSKFVDDQLVVGPNQKPDVDKNAPGLILYSLLFLHTYSNKSNMFNVNFTLIYFKIRNVVRNQRSI